MVDIDIPQEIQDDIDTVFRYEHDIRPQDRAHAYLANHRVSRGYNDTAMQVAVTDMCRRSFAAGIAARGSDQYLEALEDIRDILDDVIGDQS